MRATTAAKVSADRIRAWYGKRPRNPWLTKVLRAIWNSGVVRTVVEKGRALDSRPSEPRDLKPVFCRDAPSGQTIADVLHGIWYSEFPDEYGIRTGGAVRHFDFSVDGRVKWVDSILSGGLQGRSILELGSFEAYNTWQMEKLGAAAVISIEANNINFLKCLLVKEITGLKARFLHGDFEPYLRQCGQHYDVIWASGILYHQTRPLELIDLMARASSSVFVSTHYYHPSVASDGLKARHFSPKRDSFVEWRGRKMHLHHRIYRGGKHALFSGGPSGFSYWISREDLLDAFREVGLSKITLMSDDPGASNGPVINFLAEKQ